MLVEMHAKNLDVNRRPTDYEIDIQTIKFHFLEELQMLQEDVSR
jgi:hypothetical protein